MSFLFGKRKTPEQMMRENQRALTKTIRELDREKARLENEEKKVVNDIKKMAKQGQMDAVKIMAKDLAVSLKIQTLRSTNAMAQAMKGVTKTMQRMNKSMNMPQLQKIMMEFEKESNIMEMKEEMMTDTIDDVLGEEGDEEESDKLVQQVLDELGIEMAGTLQDLNPSSDSMAAKNKTPGRATAAVDGLPAPPSNTGDDDDLEARLARLKRN